MGLFSKKPKSIVVQQPAHKAAEASAEAMDRLEQLLPKFEAEPDELPNCSTPRRSETLTVANTDFDHNPERETRHRV